MRIYYVTGIFGVGKSAVCRELKKRGYVAYDDDEHNITSWREKESGKYLGGAKRIAGPNGSKLELYDWYMSKDRVLELAKSENSEIMFICGTASNRNDVWDLFEDVFCLSIDEDTLRQRLARRKNNDFGKDPVDLVEILAWHKSSEQKDVESGAILINATKSIGYIVDSIIKRTAEQLEERTQ